MSADDNDRKIQIQQFCAERKEEGLKIDPETAEVLWDYAVVTDPYDIHPDIPEEYKCVGRAYFARAPESKIWVYFGDLPRATADRLWEKHRRELAFPAGLEHFTGRQ